MTIDIDPNHKGRKGSISAAFLALVLLLSACGSGADNGLTAGTDNSNGTEEESEPDTEPALAFPPSTLPISASFELPQPAAASIETGGKAYFMHDAALSRVTPGSDVVEFLDLDLEFEFIAWWMGATDSHVLISGSDLSLTSPNILVVVDIETFEVSGVEVGAAGTERLVAAHHGGATIPVAWNSGADQWFDFDPASMTQGDLIPFEPDIASLFSVDGEWWNISDSGTIQILDMETYEVLGSFDFGTPVGQWAVGQVGSDDESVWLRNQADGTIRRVDRATLEVDDPISVGERYGVDTWFELRASRGGYSWAIADVEDERGNVLYQLDPTSGEILWEHTIAPATDDYWGPQWLYFPEIQVVDGGLYVLDHPNRVVEVDLARLGDADTGTFVDPGLPAPTG